MRRVRAGIAWVLLWLCVPLSLLGALIWLHGQWIARMTDMVGAAEMAARGYVPGMLPLHDPTFAAFARGYLWISGALAIFAALALFFFRRASVRRRLGARNQLADALDGMLRGEMPPPDADALLDQKKRQVFTALAQRADEAAREREKLMTLVNDLSHQIKTPIASAKLHVELLGDSSLDDGERANFLAALSGQLDKIAMLTGALVRLARLEAGMIRIDVVDADVSQTIFAAVRDTETKARDRRIGITCLVAPLTVPHDVTWTKEALVNILDNAVKYAPDGSAVTVTLTPGSLYACIDISDAGIGIPDGDQGRIFARFYRGERARKLTDEGSGLGLTIAQEILRAQGGAITVTSAPGQGARFSVFLQNRSSPVSAP